MSSEVDGATKMRKGDLVVAPSILDLAVQHRVCDCQDVETGVVKQHSTLGNLVTRDDEGVTLSFSEDAIDAIADVAVSVNSTVENIGARRLQTIMERVLDDISFAATDRSGETVRIEGDYVRSRVADLAKNADLSRFIL